MGFTHKWVLSKMGGFSIGYINNLYIGGKRNGAELNLYLVNKHTLISGQWEVLVIFVVWTVFLVLFFSCVHMHLWSGSAYVSLWHGDRASNTGIVRNYLLSAREHHHMCVRTRSVPVQ